MPLEDIKPKDTIDQERKERIENNFKDGKIRNKRNKTRRRVHSIFGEKNNHQQNNRENKNQSTKENSKQKISSESNKKGVPICVYGLIAGVFATTAGIAFWWWNYYRK
eukprot:gb/GECH01005021.1/.p1 GENE.gb/GECH01005021.1/~~gb/GECH01005021.1/.p1  ORF type:complete len:108 (+),score=36.86 gb/GECH01005021.1/:1-324(+)